MDITSQNFYKNTSNQRNRIIIQSKYKDNCDCSLCLSDMKSCSVKWLPCGHHLHSKCFDNLINSNCDNKYKCPECRQCFHSAIPGTSHLKDDNLNNDLLEAFSPLSWWIDTNPQHEPSEEETRSFNNLLNEHVAYQTASIRYFTIINHIINNNNETNFENINNNNETNFENINNNNNYNYNVSHNPDGELDTSSPIDIDFIYIP